MPLETASYISQLVAANPVHTDGINQADAHLRLIKAVLQATFPNLNAPVTAAPGDLNNTTGLVSVSSGLLTVPIPTGSTGVGGGVTLKGAGVHPDIKLVNLGATGLSITSGSTTVATIDGAGDVNFPANMNAASITQAGNLLLPRGVICLWSGSIASVPAGWLLCNGSNGTPDLRDRFIIGAGGSVGPGSTGGASSTTPTTSSDGAHNHAGASGAAGNATPTGTMDTQGAHTHTGLTAGHALSVAELASHTHEQQIGQGSGGGGTAWNVTGPGSSVSDAGFATLSQGSGSQHTHGISSDGSHTHNITMNALPTHTHTISSDGAHTHTVAVATLPPFFALAYIMKS